MRRKAFPSEFVWKKWSTPNQPTPSKYNTTAVGFANKTIKQKRSKAIDMRFYWVQDRCNQCQFVIYWAPGANNLGDYHTKVHSPSHCKKMRPTILHAPHFANHLISLLRGCAKTPFSPPPTGNINHPSWG